MSFNEKTPASVGLKETRHGKLIQSRLNNALFEEKKKLEDEGYEIPNTYLSVQGDTRQYWNPEKYFTKSIHH
ncbi:MAG: hypothetical protein N4A48_07795 [Tepidibacter sp.]|jgi:hypothetical protein|uniref:hypothetical protein n=1 Tax=Tepidibacter sp. TaxID=2529387 RepID=UPI0025DDDB67|nr:hypothetical protein [Tepidibacter sp.]MCT4508650.1 hypothetical protein [Tepidibacter sp.]MCT4585446.1 hypothetical protein [Peptostreptococcaceae bacterium]